MSLFSALINLAITFSSSFAACRSIGISTMQGPDRPERANCVAAVHFAITCSGFGM